MYYEFPSIYVCYVFCSVFSFWWWCDSDLTGQAHYSQPIKHIISEQLVQTFNYKDYHFKKQVFYKLHETQNSKKCSKCFYKFQQHREC
jgi:hypothetical protein